jgi:hypothetical protein
MTGGGKPRRRINWLFLSSRPFLVLLPACLCASWIALQHHADLVLLDNAIGSSATMTLMMVPDEAPLLKNGQDSFINNNNASQRQRHHQPPSSRPASRSTKVLSSTRSTTTNSGNSSSDHVRESSLVQALLHQSLCDVESSFVKLLDANGPATTATATTVQTWAARLVYLAVYEHQNEVLLPSDDDDRSSASSSVILQNDDKDDNMNTKDDGGDDDCTTISNQNKTKFLVFAYGKSGLGANVRLGAVPALQLGLATNRRVININRAPFGPPFIQEPWPWAASCSDQSRHRYRAECYFRPLTTLCWDPKGLDGAPVLTKAEARYAFRTGRMPAALEDEQYLILHVTFRPQRDPETLRGIVASKARDLAERLRWTDSPSSATVREALELIRAKPKLNDVGDYDYYGVNSVIFHGLLLYAMRPTTAVSSELKRTLADVTRHFDESTVGVPIRGKRLVVSHPQRRLSHGVCALFHKQRPTSVPRKANAWLRNSTWGQPWKQVHSHLLFSLRPRQLKYKKKYRN